MLQLEKQLLWKVMVRYFSRVLLDGSAMPSFCKFYMPLFDEDLENINIFVFKRSQKRGTSYIPSVCENNAQIFLNLIFYLQTPENPRIQY